VKIIRSRDRSKNEAIKMAASILYQQVKDSVMRRVEENGMDSIPPTERRQIRNIIQTYKKIMRRD